MPITSIRCKHWMSTMSTALAWSQSLLHLHPKASIVSSDAYSESEVIREKQLFCVRDPCATHLCLPLTVLSFFRRCLHALLCHDCGTGCPWPESRSRTSRNQHRKKTSWNQKSCDWNGGVGRDSWQLLAIIQGSEDLRSSGKCVPSPPWHLLNLLIDSIYCWYHDIYCALGVSPA